MFHDPKLAINRVYTRTGDAGQTRLVGGQKVEKNDLRIEAYGTVDELNAFVGAAVDSCRELSQDELADVLVRVQHALFNLGSILATLPADVHPQQPRVREGDVLALEQDMDRRNEALPTLRVTYLNRLSDAFFVWSRAVNHVAGKSETLWRPNEA